MPIAWASSRQRDAEENHGDGPRYEPPTNPETLCDTHPVSLRNHLLTLHRKAWSWPAALAISYRVTARSAERSPTPDAAKP